MFRKLTLAFAVSSLTLPLIAASIYQVTQISTLPTTTSFGAYTGLALSQNGLVAVSLISNGSGGGYIFDNGTLTPLTAFNQALPVDVGGINNSGQVAGTVIPGGARLWLTPDTAPIPSFPPPPPGTFIPSTALDVNNSGIMVGEAAVQFTVSNRAGFIYNPAFGVPTMLSEFNQINAINDLGDVVGQLQSGNVAIRWANGVVQDLGISGRPTAINSLGQVTYTSGGGPGVFVPGLGAISLPIPNPTGINLAGVIVGTNANPFDTRALIYQNGAAVDLNTLIFPFPGLTLREARGINNAGQIIAIGTLDGLPRSQQFAFLLTPTEVPEPSSLALAGLGLAALLRQRRHALALRNRRSGQVIENDALAG